MSNLKNISLTSVRVSSYRYIICNSLLDKSLFVCPLDEDADKFINNE